MDRKHKILAFLFILLQSLYSNSVFSYSRDSYLIAATRGKCDSFLKLDLPSSLERVFLPNDERIFSHINEALIAAADSGHLHCVDNLLTIGANPNTIGDHFSKYRNLTPLEVAISRGHFEIVKKLVESGANPDGSLAGRNPFTNFGLAVYSETFLVPTLSKALFSNRPEIVRYLFNTLGLFDFFRKYRYRTTAQIVMCESPTVETLSTLMELGIPVFGKSVEKFGSPLSAAIKYSNTEVINFLLNQSNASLMYNSSEQEFEIRHVIYSHNTDMLKTLLSHQLINNKKWFNTDHQGIDAPFYHIDPRYVFTPLTFAIFTDDAEATEVLLEYGANPNSIDLDLDTRGDPIIFRAIRDKQHKILKLLLSHGANPNSRKVSNLNSSALDYALRNNDIISVSLLLQAGAQINTRASNHSPSLLFSLTEYKGQNGGDLVRMIVDAGANPNALDYHDNTPLLWASFYNNTSAIKWLVANGADIHMSSTNKTPLSIALEHGDSETITLLRKLGAKK